MIAEIYYNGVSLYRTPHIEMLLDRHFIVDRNHPEHIEQRISQGPHFWLNLPSAYSEAIDGRCPKLDARGCWTLGSVYFVTGAQARDGCESYDVSSLKALWDVDVDGLKISVQLEVGQPDPSSFCYEPPKRDTDNYRIEASIPMRDLARFRKLENPEALELLRNNVAARFGQNAAESILPYV